MEQMIAWAQTKFLVPLLCFFCLSNCAQLLEELDKLAALEQGANATTSLQNIQNADLLKAGSWTILVFLDADNNLEGAGVKDIEEMRQATAKAGSTQKVYVLFDRIAGYSTAKVNSGSSDLSNPNETGTDGGTGTNLLLVENGTVSEVVGTSVSDFGCSSEECNMGDGTVLKKFLEWGMQQSVTDGTDYVFVDIWDHGAGWGGASYGGKAIAWDDSDGHDALTLTEIRDAVVSANAVAADKTVTIVGYDACYMGTLANAFNLKGQAMIMIGSEETEPGDGWDYINWVPTAAISPADLASQVVTSYASFYSGVSSKITLSAINLTRLDSFSTAINSFVQGLVATDSNLIASARSKAQTYNNNSTVDLGHFMSLTGIPEATAAQTALKSILIAEAHPSFGSVKNSTGLAAYFPANSNNYDTSYSSTQLAANSKWDEFVAGKLSSTSSVNSEPAGDCGSEPNDTTSVASTSLTTSNPCTAFIYTASDMDLYKVKLKSSGLGTSDYIEISLTVPGSSNYNMYLFVPDLSPSSPVAIGAYKTTGGDEKIRYFPNTGKVYLDGTSSVLCDPSDSSNSYYQQGYCYGQGINLTNTAKDFYIVVLGASGSFSQSQRYSLSIALSGSITEE
jgi:hypothetical protein